MIDKQHQPVILSAVRTPSGNFQGSLSGFPAPRLGAIVLAGAVQRAALPVLTDIDEVFMGNVLSAGLGQAPAGRSTPCAG